MLAPGTVIERYIVQTVLGRGGLATVYAVKHATLGTKHALKVLDDDRPSVTTRLVREGQLQARLDPTYVVPVTDTVTVNGAPALVMPLIIGCSLDAVLKRIVPQPHAIASLMHAIASGVASAHRAGVIHRDLKPGNILLEERRGKLQIRVADFGLARTDDTETLTRGGEMLGTIAYAAPEQIEDAAKATHLADLWALGVILYELVVGQRPFRGQTHAMLYQVLQGKYDKSLISPEWLEPIENLMQVDPSQRWDDAEILIQWLAEHFPPKPLVVGDPLVEIVKQEASESDYSIALSRAANSGSFARGDNLNLSFSDPVSDTKSVALTIAAERSVARALPAERGRFIGREHLLHTIQLRLAEGERLLTLLGIGGSGKTKLAVRYGWQHSDDWPGGVWFCDLAEARSLDGIVSAVAASFGVTIGPGESAEQMANVLAGRGKCLIILDNFEQVSRFSHQTLGVWYRMCPQAHFMVTSREILGLRGESAIPVPPLEETEALELFLALAKDANARFSPSEEDHKAIEKLVELLDYLPLAIELAAARVRVLNPQKLLARINDRFRLLTSASGRRDRQSTLRATLDWSWNLLAEWEKSALAQISIFEGGFDLESVEAVVDLDEFEDAPWPMDALQSLVEKSLVRPVADDRMSLLVSVHEYATEKLGKMRDRDDVVARHIAHFIQFGVDAAIAALDTHGGTELRNNLALELDNIMAAHRRAMQQDDVHGATYTLTAAWAVLRIQGPPQPVMERAHTMLVHPDLSSNHPSVENADLRGRVLIIAGQSALRVGDLVAASQHFSEAIAYWEARGDTLQLGISRLNHGIIEWRRGQLQEAEASFRQAKDAGLSVQNRQLTASAIANIALLAGQRGDAHAAKEGYERALTIHQSMGNQRNTAITLANLASTLDNLGQPKRALRALENAYKLYHDLGHRAGMGTCALGMGRVDVQLGRSEAAKRNFERALKHSVESGQPASRAAILVNLAGVYMSEQAWATARTQLEEAVEVAMGARPAVAGVAFGLLAIVEAKDGLVEVAHDYLDRAKDLLTTANWTIEICKLHAQRATVYALTGHIRQAKEALAEAEEMAESQFSSSKDVSVVLEQAQTTIREASASGT